jgi:serine/threonine protein kinase
MAERCPACDAIVDDTGVAPGGPLRCGKCGTRFPKSRARPAAAGGGASVDANKWTVKDDPGGLGIHPALARKYQKASMPPSQPADLEPNDTDAESPQLPELPGPGALPAAVPPPRKDTRVLGQRPDLMAPTPALLDSEEGPSPGTTNPGRPLQRNEPARAAPSPAQKPAPPGEPLPFVPGYEVTELVGKGAMGRVYGARQIASGKPSAIKILAPELAARQDFIQRFEREGAAMRAVNHPGVVAVMDAGAARQPDGSTAYYICMDYIEGPPLRRHLDKGALPPDRALRYARLIIQGLGAAHARGVIHRDLKPENILAPPAPDGDDRLVLVDFGLAGILDEENDPHPNLTKSRMTMGTVNYMAPEQRTDAKRVDQRADLYAAGVILYELLTGDLPLGRFALPTERGVPVPASVDRCIVRALARNPDERYQVAAQFDEDLRAIEAELRKTAGEDTVIGRARTTGGGGGRTNQRSIVDDVITTGDVLSVGSDGAAQLSQTAWMSAVPWIKKPSLVWAAALFGGVLLFFVLKALGVLPS